jgi:hypothetical protein
VPADVLEGDPDLVRRAQENDVPFEPVWQEGDKFVAPEFSREAKQPWQTWIRENVYKNSIPLLSDPYLPRDLDPDKRVPQKAALVPESNNATRIDEATK